MIDVLTFNGVSLADFNTYWDGSQLFVTPEKDVEFFSVPGRSGELTISNNRYNAKEVNVDCFIKSNFKQNFANLVDYLYAQDGYQRLENSKEPDIFQMASFVKAIEPNTGAFLKYGDFTLTFKVYPQKWLKSGEIAIGIESSMSLVNPTHQIASPLIEVTGTGSVTINGSVLTLSNNTSTTYIDCEIQDAYEGTINRNGDLTVSNGFPVLVDGTNAISMTGFTTCNLYPRWWRL